MRYDMFENLSKKIYSFFNEQKTESEELKKLEIEKKHDNLIKACEAGDEEAYLKAIFEGANVNVPNHQGKDPLGAAMFGMNKNIIKSVLNKVKNENISWDKYQYHNLKFYKKVFLTEEFSYKTYGQWERWFKSISKNTYLTGLMESETKVNSIEIFNACGNDNQWVILSPSRDMYDSETKIAPRYNSETLDRKIKSLTEDLKLLMQRESLLNNEVLTSAGLFKPLIRLVLDYAEETYEADINNFSAPESMVKPLNKR